jgi:hypothetical protein
MIARTQREHAANITIDGKQHDVCHVLLGVPFPDDDDTAPELSGSGLGRFYLLFEPLPISRLSVCGIASFR